MENVVLIIHLILALSLIGTVLLQRSEGGGLGMGGGGGGATGGRPAPTAMSKFTWALAVAFICTSIALTLIAANNTAGSSVVDRLGGDTATEQDTDAPDLGGSLLPPVADDAPLLPSGD
ncbi:preprotein translocase subunit SecG [Yoonia sp.]|uniref:preprotein translocase subunit SecG n=1 Tax=Yoonia sp. TaxID=2212373 RepID=UPI003F6B5989